MKIRKKPPSHAKILKENLQDIGTRGSQFIIYFIDRVYKPVFK